jgi:hypothetical protein
VPGGERVGAGAALCQAIVSDRHVQVAALVYPVTPVGRPESSRVHRSRAALLAVRAIARDAHNDHHGGADKKGQFGGGPAGEATLLRALLSLVSATLLGAALLPPGEGLTGADLNRQEASGVTAPRGVTELLSRVAAPFWQGNRGLSQGIVLAGRELDHAGWADTRKFLGDTYVSMPSSVRASCSHRRVRPSKQEGANPMAHKRQRSRPPAAGNQDLKRPIIIGVVQAVAREVAYLIITHLRL